MKILQTNKIGTCVQNNIFVPMDLRLQSMWVLQEFSLIRSPNLEHLILNRMAVSSIFLGLVEFEDEASSSAVEVCS